MTPVIEPLYAIAIFILITSIGQTLFASILLVMSKHGQVSANRYLAGFMLCLCLCLCLYLLFDFWRVYLPHTTLLYQPLVFLLPPLLWFYLKLMTSPESRILPQDMVLHSIPAILVTVLLAPFFQLPGVEKIEWVYLSQDRYIQMGDVQQWLDQVIVWIYGAAILQGMSYIGFAWRMIRQHQQRIQQEYSFSQNIDLRWFIYLLVSCLVIYLFVALTLLLDLLSINSSLLWVSSFCLGCALLSIFGYFGVRQDAIYPTIDAESDMVTSKKELVSITFSKSGVEQKYKSSALSQQNVEDCYAELLAYMADHQPYNNPELSLRGLSASMQLPARELSRIINEMANKNFMEFVNSYRIAKAKKLLLESNTLKVLDIAMEVGFHSKSAFYEAFRKVTGTTPSQFKRKIGQSS